MGMSASQMRYCLIAGRKSDVEFQGQQINQQRTTLATQSSSYNTQLLDLKVPTPPSTSDYTNTTYTFTSNGESRTVVGTQYKPNDYIYEGETYDGGTYVVNYTTDRTTSQGKSSGTSVFSSSVNAGVTTYKTSTGTVLTPVIMDPTSSLYDAKDISNISLICQDCDLPTTTSYTAGGANLSAIDLADPANAAHVTNLQTIYGASYNPAGTYYNYVDNSGATPTSYYVAQSEIAGTGNSTVHSVDNSNPMAPVVNNATASVIGTTNYPQFYTYVDGGVTKYVPQTALDTVANTTTPTSTYFVDPDASVTQSAAIAGATVQWNSSGRMTSITDSEGNKFTPSVKTVNDEDAYKDAFNEYEYQKAVYDETMGKINAQMEIIAAQDKKLELKLQNLDTQQKALDTEMDAVKKVIEKNVETTFKTFA